MLNKLSNLVFGVNINEVQLTDIMFIGFVYTAFAIITIAVFKSAY